MKNFFPDNYLSFFSLQSPRRASTRQRRSKPHPALLESMEPRLLLSGTYSPANLLGTLALAGLNKAGSLSFDGRSVVNGGGWVNQSGPPSTQIAVGLPNTYTVDTAGQVSLNLSTEPVTQVIPTFMNLTGNINATADVVALNEISSGTPAGNGLDLLVNHTGTFTTSDFAGTWNIAAQDFRGNITVNAAGHVTTGLIFLENGQKSAAVTGGTVVLNADGTGTLTFTTKFTGANSAFSTISLNITLNSVMDTAVGNDSAIGDGVAPAELTVLIKNSGTYAKSDVFGTSGQTWNLNAAFGDGSITFNPNGKLTGSITDTSGTVQTVSGNYSLGGNGTILANLTLTSGNTTTRESLFGALNQSKNLMALDRAIANGQLSSSLTILSSSLNHPPTERLVATLPQSAFQASAVNIDFPTLATASSAHDLDHDSLSFVITDVPAANGTLSLTHNGVTTIVIPGTDSTPSNTMVIGDTLTWTPAATDAGSLNAFTIQAFDGSELAVNPTKIFLVTGALPLITAISTKSNALEAKAGLPAGNATIQLQRAGGDMTQPLTVTISDLGGNAVMGTNYNLLAPDGSTISSNTATITFPANQSTVNLTVVPLQDNTVDPTLTVVVTVLPDLDIISPTYKTAVHHVAQVNVLDGDPSVFVVPAVPSINEGSTGAVAFFVERLPAQGGNLNASLPVTVTFSGTFDVAHHLTIPTNPTTVTFDPGEVKKRILLTTTDDGIADPTQTIVASLSGGGFSSPAGQNTASVNVLDASPVVRLVTNRPNAQEANPTKNFGQFTVFRSGDTTDPLVVDFNVASGAGFGTLGTNFTLTDSSGNNLTNSVTIPAGQNSIIIKVTPIDDFLNEPTLQASIALVQDSTPSYNVALLPRNNTAIIHIINNDRFPTIANHTLLETTPKNTELDLSFSQLVTAMGAALNAQSAGTLELKVGQILAGHLRVLRNGITSTLAANSILMPGDQLEWTPPAGITAPHLPAFTLFALDGSLESLGSTLFKVAIT